MHLSCLFYLFCCAVVVKAHKLIVKCSVLHNGLLIGGQASEDSAPICITAAVNQSLQYRKCDARNVNQKWTLVRYEPYFRLSIRDPETGVDKCLHLGLAPEPPVLGPCLNTSETNLFHFQPLVIRSLARGKLLGGYCMSTSKHSAQRYEVHNHFKACCLHFKFVVKNVTHELSVAWASIAENPQVYFQADDTGKMIYLGDGFYAVSEPKKLSLTDIGANTTTVIRAPFCRPQEAITDSNTPFQCLKYLHEHGTLPKLPTSATDARFSTFSLVCAAIFSFYLCVHISS